MTRLRSPKLAGYAALSATGLLAALAAGQPELVALAAPFLVALGLGLAVAQPPRLTVGLAVDRDRALEGDEVTARVSIAAAAPVDRLDVYVGLPDALAAPRGANPVSIRLKAGEHRELELPLSTGRFGGHVVGPVVVRAHDPLGFLAWETVSPTRATLRVYPGGDVLQRALRARDTQVHAGNEVSRHRGEGIEFADMRPWTAGDPLKRVNWRASARRSEVWVNESHPERNTDVILFVDSFAEARSGDTGTLDLAIRAAASLADAYIGRRDRVGVIGYGGILRWLQPGGGVVQLYRIVDALIDTEIVLSYYWKQLDILPRRTLPPGALVVALSPLLDARSVGALLDLRARGFDLVVLDISPLPFAPRPRDGLDAVAYDIWVLRRDALRHRLQRAGVAVAEWHSGTPLQQALEEVREFRRRARLVHA